MLSDNPTRAPNNNSSKNYTSGIPVSAFNGEDDSLSLKENMPCALNSDQCGATDARTSSTTACMTRSTLTSRVSGNSDPFTLTEKSIQVNSLNEQ